MVCSFENSKELIKANPQEIGEQDGEFEDYDCQFFYYIRTFFANVVGGKFDNSDDKKSNDSEKADEVVSGFHLDCASMDIYVSFQAFGLGVGFIYQLIK